MRNDAEPRRVELLGRRIARLRAEIGWNQTDLAERLGMSRTAVSHLEAGMSGASERTVIVLAGLFRLEPPELVSGTDFPTAKAERLPTTVARYSEPELLEQLILHDLARSGSLTAIGRTQVLDEWATRVSGVSAPAVRAALRRLRDALA